MIDNHVLEALRRRAFQRNLTVSLLIQEAVQSYLAEQEAEPEQEVPFELVTYGAEGRLPDVNLDKTSILLAQDDLENHGRKS